MEIYLNQTIALIEKKGDRKRTTKVIDIQDRFVVLQDVEQVWLKESFLKVDMENDLHPVYKIVVHAKT